MPCAVAVFSRIKSEKNRLGANVGRPGPAKRKSCGQRLTVTISKKKVPAADLLSVKPVLVRRTTRLFMRRRGEGVGATCSVLFHV